MIELDVRDIVSFLNNMKNGKSALLAGLKAFALDQIKIIKDNMDKQVSPDGTPYPTLSPLSLLSRRKGGGKRLLNNNTLRNSISISAISDDTVKISAGMVGDLKYAALQQYGGTIVPVNAKMLSIPLNPQAALVSPRQYSDKLFVWHGHKNVFLAEPIKKGKNTSLKMAYLLLPKVTIPATPYMGFSPDAGERLTQILTKEIHRTTINF